MPFYFYAYYPNPKVTLHRGECRFCKQGKGMQPGKLGYITGRWRGGYLSLELALEAAQSIGQGLGVEPTYCQRCRPETAILSDPIISDSASSAHSRSQIKRPGGKTL
ncbi:hypothetical protein [Spirosoma sp. KNUC1025]|uniref:hypothetical protein n=1 Tax=Spirosoma sp. KNUC1025 TaxID=2894082 RepID=UPI003865A4B9|nr:hypothetical protein LN737_10935 [Spirosoma sp. KNUC1025]